MELPKKPQMTDIVLERLQLTIPVELTEDQRGEILRVLKAFASVIVHRTTQSIMEEQHGIPFEGQYTHPNGRPR